MVGKPVFHNYLNMEHGAWLRDPIQKDNLTIEKIWLTKENEPTNLYEYKNRNDYRKDKPSRIQPFKLPCPFKVLAPTALNISVLYFLIHFAGKRAHCLQLELLLLLRRWLEDHSIRFENGASCKWVEPRILLNYKLRHCVLTVTRVLEEVNNTKTLYTTQYNVVDFNADDNGLWIIHAAPESNHTIVSKINETNLETINSFDISIHHHQVGEMFIGKTFESAERFELWVFFSQCAEFFTLSILQPPEKQRSDSLSICTRRSSSKSIRHSRILSTEPRRSATITTQRSCTLGISAISSLIRWRSSRWVRIRRLKNRSIRFCIQSDTAPFGITIDALWLLNYKSS